MTWQRKIIRNKKRLILVLAGVIVSALIGWWGIAKYIESQKAYPLGDNSQIVYIGKQDYGCNGLCDSAPGTTYFYETDLTPPELASHFTQASTIKPEKVKAWKEQGSQFFIDFKTQNGGFALYYYRNGTKEFSDFRSTKEYVFTLDSKYYQIAKDSL